MVVGCAVLETAQPMMAQTEVAPKTGPAADTVIFPAGESAGRHADVSGGGFSSAGSWVFALLVGGGAAGVWWWQRHRIKQGLSSQGGGLAVEQSKSLGNRQFLVVAKCDGRRFLLGVAPGQINLLSALDDAPATPEFPDVAPGN
tara:strand:- start:31 stop:462 length:432 start_codon:yes stop_codon:yes gene_type:complete